MEWLIGDDSVSVYAMASEEEIVQLGHQWDKGLSILCIYDGQTCEEPIVENHRSVSERYGNCYTMDVTELTGSPGKAHGQSIKTGFISTFALYWKN